MFAKKRDFVRNVFNKTPDQQTAIANGLTGLKSKLSLLE